MTAPTVPPSRHAQIQQRVDAFRTLSASGCTVIGDIAPLIDDLFFLLNENRNIRYTLDELQAERQTTQ